MSDPLDGPITGKQMVSLLRELREDSARDLDARFSDQTSELNDIITAAVLGGADNVRRHVDRRIDDLSERVDGLTERVERLEAVRRS